MGKTVTGSSFIARNPIECLYLQLLEEAITPGVLAAFKNKVFDCYPILQQDLTPP